MIELIRWGWNRATIGGAVIRTGGARAGLPSRLIAPRSHFSCFWMIGVVMGTALLPAALLTAQERPATDRLFPLETKSYIAIPDPEEFRVRWERTELGRLLQDPVMTPFREDLREQIDRDLLQAEVRLGVTWQDIDGVAGGEMAMGMVTPPGENSTAAILSLVDISGREEQVQRLTELVNQNLRERGGTRTETQRDGHTVVHWHFPPTKQQPVARDAYFCRHNGWFVATDHEDILTNVLARIDNHANNALVELDAYRAVMDRCSRDPQPTEPHLRWFVDPFGYAEGLRTVTGSRERTRDRIQILKKQGFSAIEGMGGVVFLAAVESQDIIHRSFVYAPREKRVLAARMLHFPATPPLQLPPWVTQQFASIMTFNWEMAQAFDASETLVNALAGNDIFQPALDDIKVDPNGLEVDIRAEIIQYLGKRVLLATEIQQPINMQSEKHLAAFELTDAARVEATLNRAMPRDPSVIRRVFGNQVVWEIIRKENLDEDAGRGGFSPIRRAPGENLLLPDSPRGPATPLFKNAGMTIAFGHLIYASDVEFLGRFLNRADRQSPLSNESDYQVVRDALRELGDFDQASFQQFVRTDEAYEPNYEMFRQGKMAQNESIVGFLLNWILAPDDEGIEREQRYDGSKLPEFSHVRPYFRPAGMFVVTEQGGWYATGCLLGREPRRASLP